jgi:hypothetical protein
MTRGDFQSQVNVAQAPASAGDFCDKNPRYSFDAGPGGLVAGPNGCLVGHFAWVYGNLDGDGTPSVVSSSGFGPVSGFIHREQQGLIVNYLASSGLTVQPGFGVTVMTGGGFWALNSGSNEALVGMKAYANFADGAVTFAAAGSPTAGGTSTASTIAAKTANITGTVADDVLTVTVATGDVIVAGSQLSGTGINSGTEIVSQISGTPGGVGTYQLNVGEYALGSTAITGTYGLLTVGGTVAGNFAVGQTVTGSGITANTHIRQAGTGVGLAGTYYVDLTQTIGSQAINTSSNVETRWFARSTGLANELVKISDKLLG